MREPRCATILAILSRTLGPLLAVELVELVERITLEPCTALRVDLSPLERFVIGDGAISGLALSHPRLNEFFGGEAFAPGNASRIDKAILAWGREIAIALKDTSMIPASAPTYLVEHFSDHLERNNAVLADYEPLVSLGWARACEQFDPTYRGFLVDLQRTALAAERVATSHVAQRAVSVPWLIRCAVYRATFRMPWLTLAHESLGLRLLIRMLQQRQVLHLLSGMIHRTNMLDGLEVIAAAIQPHFALPLSALVNKTPAESRKGPHSSYRRPLVLGPIATGDYRQGNSRSRAVSGSVEGRSGFANLWPSAGSIEARAFREVKAGTEGFRSLVVRAGKHQRVGCDCAGSRRDCRAQYRVQPPTAFFPCCSR